MKPLYLSIFIVLASACQNQQSIKLSDKISTTYKNTETEIKFKKAKQSEIVSDDTLVASFNFENIQKLKCKTKFRDKDFENENYFIREYEIKISDTLIVTVLQKQSKDRVVDYAYFYKDKNFNVISNYHGEMFPRKANFFFDFDGRKAYRISNDKILLSEQPSTWCGLANQFDFFQIFDLKKMEIIQFVDRDGIVK